MDTFQTVIAKFTAAIAFLIGVYFFIDSQMMLSESISIMQQTFGAMRALNSTLWFVIAILCLIWAKPRI